MKVQYIILILFFVLAPVIIIFLEKQFSLVKKVGAVLVCYGVGLILGNLRILPDGIEKSFQLGMYFILIFCIVVASMADIRQLANISFSLFWYVALAMFGSHISHAFIAKLFRIDADTVIISGSALVCAPPFVPVVAGALKNREVILTGLVVGIAGYALGNYLGVLVAYILK